MLIRLRVLRDVCIGDGVDARAGDVVELTRARARTLMHSGAAELAAPDREEETRWEVARGLRAPEAVELREEGAAT